MAGCEVIRPTELFGGKADLKPEESKQRSLGVVWAPHERFNASLDWWEIERANTIRSGFSLTQMAANYDAYKDSYIRDQSDALVAIDQRAINSGGTLSRAASNRAGEDRYNTVNPLSSKAFPAHLARKVFPVPVGPNR